jgi:hypothetical protein
MRIEWGSTIPISQVSDGGQMQTSPLLFEIAGLGDKLRVRSGSQVVRAIPCFAGTRFASVWILLISGYPIGPTPHGR